MMNASNAQKKINKATTAAQKYTARKEAIGTKVAARRAKRPDAKRVRGEGKLARIERRLERGRTTIAKGHAILRPAL